MGSFLLKKLFVTVTFIVFCVTGQLLQAEKTPDQKKLSVIDGYYPAYPSTAPATGERQNLIQRGEYLAKMGDCISCHTNVKAGTPAYAGGLPIATPFGTFYSPNITPDKETGIGNWTEEDFIRALKEGRDPHGRNYFPVFPYIYFSKITEEDASALYAYFMSLPPVYLPNKPLPFPFNVPGCSFRAVGMEFTYFSSLKVKGFNIKKNKHLNGIEVNTLLMVLGIAVCVIRH